MKNLKSSVLICSSDRFPLLQVSLYHSTASPIVVGPGLLSMPCWSRRALLTMLNEDTSWRQHWVTWKWNKSFFVHNCTKMKNKWTLTPPNKLGFCITLKQSGPEPGSKATSNFIVMTTNKRSWRNTMENTKSFLACHMNILSFLSFFLHLVPP